MFLNLITMKELELIKQSIKNNREAQHLLFNKFAGKFLGIVIRYVGDKDLAHDLLQESFIKIFNNLKNYKEVNNFEAWAKTIVINTTIDYLRKNKKNKEFAQSEFIENQAGFLIDDEEFDDDLVLDISANDLVELINKLPTASRVVFNMKVVDNFTHKEIAKRLNISVGSSKSNYSYARVRLQKFIKQYFEEKIV